MPNKTITINRRKYATDLMWQPDAPGYAARAYAHNLARGIDRKLNLYTAFRAMVGLGARRHGHRAGMFSAAAEVMDSLTEYNSFLGVFPISGKYYLIAVRNGIILRDQLIDNETDARAEYFDLTEIPDWNALFAPGSWGAPRAVERSLSDLITGRAHAFLHSISWFRAGVFMTIVLTVFAAILLHFFSGPIGEMLSPRPQIAQIDPERAAEYKRQIEAKNRQLDEQFEIERAKPVEPIVLPYDILPNRYARADVCYQAIGFLMQPVVGWNQVSAECGETHALATFHRDFGTLVEFYQIAGNLMPGSLVTETNENTIMAQATLPTVKLSASVDERDAETIVRDVTSVFQAAATPLDSIEIVTDTLTNGVDVVVLNVVEIAAESKLTPMQFIKIFDEFGGVYMSRAVWDAQKRFWKYEVIIYAKQVQ